VIVTVCESVIVGIAVELGAFSVMTIGTGG
jgi:hypothetical protein